MYKIDSLSPAYGRDYRNRDDAISHFNEDKDFITPMGQYVNKSQLKELGLKHVWIRYDKLKKQVMARIEE